ADPSAEFPLATIERSEAAAAVRSAVAALPDNQRAAVILSRWKGLSYQEIAETMEITVMAVKSLLSRAKENLRYKLQVVLGGDEEDREAGGV
ncbi:MAG: RNA polymerase sigma factor, partial [Planctomycetota bacterium]